MREIDDVLYFRSDLSPFLVHLTKRAGSQTASSILETILREGKLNPGDSLVSDVRFGGKTNRMTEEEKRDFFSAICFTETPLNEAHCLLEIQRRSTNLEPYGLAFLKDNLQRKGVTPVYYINNELADKNDMARALFSLTETHRDAAKELLPLFSVFGQDIHTEGFPRPERARPLDFLWEREWRYPAAKGHLEFTEDDVFVGLCPDDEIGIFEFVHHPVKFIDPRYNMKWYATKLIESRQRLKLKYSVV